MTLTLTAKIIKITTVPYSEQEMSELSPEEYSRVKELNEEKVTGEQVVAEIHAETVDDLRESILHVSKILDNMSLIVLTDAFPDSFLVGRQYWFGDPNALFENIQFRTNDDHPSRNIQVQKPRERRTKPFQENLDAQDKVDETVDKLFKESGIEGFIDEMTRRMFKGMTEGVGVNSFQEYLELARSSVQKELQSTNDLKEAVARASMEMQNRWYEHGGKGSYVDLWNPKKQLEKTTILFRVVGKNMDTNVSHMGYYSRLHKIEGFSGFPNSVSGTPSARFIYPPHEES